MIPWEKTSPSVNPETCDPYIGKKIALSVKLRKAQHSHQTVASIGP